MAVSPVYRIVANVDQSSVLSDTDKAHARTNIGAAADAVLQTEITNREAADTTLSNRIGTLATNLSTEISDREAADTAINAAKQDKITATTTTLTANVVLTQGQCEVTFNLSSGKTSVVTFDIYIDVSTSSTDAHPLIEILNGTTVLDNFYSSIGSTTGSVSRVHYASYSKVFTNLSSVTVRMYYDTYLLNGGTFAVNMTKVEI